MKKALADRFWKFVEKKTPGECWLWTGAKTPNGYGAFWIGGKKRNEGAHRMVYLLERGAILSGMVVMHSCDNRQCVNPNHLSVGSHCDNVNDSVKKNRAKCTKQNGYLNSSVKLHENTVMRIKILDGVIPRSRLAKAAGVSEWSIRAITKRRHWRHLGTRQALTVEAEFSA